jgi:hypothetical protein
VRLINLRPWRISYQKLFILVHLREAILLIVAGNGCFGLTIPGVRLRCIQERWRPALAHRSMFTLMRMRRFM